MVDRNIRRLIAFQLLSISNEVNFTQMATWRSGKHSLLFRINTSPFDVSATHTYHSLNPSFFRTEEPRVLEPPLATCPLDA